MAWKEKQNVRAPQTMTTLSPGPDLFFNSSSQPCVCAIWRVMTFM